jgi:hypothetical protein
MKKMTWDEWKEQELAKRKEYKEMGVIDFETIRAKKCGLIRMSKTKTSLP